MTCREKWELDHPGEKFDIRYDCTYTLYGVASETYCNPNATMESCHKCWEQEYPERSNMNEPKEEPKLIYAHTSTDTISEEIATATAKPVIKDSGERTTFLSGAQRDMHEGKGDMASVPWEAILRLSVHYENGAKKYERWNFRKGIPVSSFIDSACRHLAKYQCGCDDEDHLAAAAFNVLGAMLMENTKPEMVDLPLRQGKNTFEYFKE